MKCQAHYCLGQTAFGEGNSLRNRRLPTDARLFDNHPADNVIFSLIRADGRTTLPERVWDMIGVIRDQALLAIEELAPADASFVLTNCLLEGHPGDRAAYERAEHLAVQRNSIFVPVLLTASDAAHAKRMASPDRTERLKMTDPVGAEYKRRTNELLRVTHPNRLDIDTTDLPPADAAQMIVSHATRLASPGSTVDEPK